MGTKKALGKIKGMPVVLEEALVAMGSPGKIRVYYGKGPTGSMSYAAVYQIGRDMLPVVGTYETAIDALNNARRYLTSRQLSTR